MKSDFIFLLALAALVSGPALASEPPHLKVLSAETGFEGTTFQLGWSSPGAAMVAQVLGDLPKDARVAGLEEGVLLRPEDSSSLVPSLAPGNDMTSVVFVPDGATAPRVAWGLVGVVSRTPSAPAELELLAVGPVLDLGAEMYLDDSSRVSRQPFSKNLVAMVDCTDEGNEVHFSWQGEESKFLVIDILAARFDDELGADRWELLRSLKPGSALLAGDHVLDAEAEASGISGRFFFPYLVVAKLVRPPETRGRPRPVVILETKVVVADCR